MGGNSSDRLYGKVLTRKMMMTIKSKYGRQDWEGSYGCNDDELRYIVTQYSLQHFNTFQNGPKAMQHTAYMAVYYIVYTVYTMYNGVSALNFSSSFASIMSNPRMVVIILKLITSRADQLIH